MAEITTSSYTIRYATEKDIPEILRMVQELASYERALHEVLATQEKLFNTLSFPTSSDEKIRNKPGAAKTLLIVPSPASKSSGASTVAHDVSAQVEVETSANAIPPSGTDSASISNGASTIAQEVGAQVEVETSANAVSSNDPEPASTPSTALTMAQISAQAEVETPDNATPPSAKEEVAGMALFFNNYSTWLAKPGIYLEDLFVRPAHRKKGYGKALLQALARECAAKDYGRLEWSVLKWNKPSIDFYESKIIGAVSTREEWEGMRVTGEALERLAKSSEL